MKHWKLPLVAALAVLGLQACDVNVREAPRTNVTAPKNSLPEDTVLNANGGARPADTASTTAAAAPAAAPVAQPTQPLDATPGPAPMPSGDATAEAPAASPQTAAMGGPAATTAAADGVAAPTELQRFFEEAAASASRNGGPNAQSGQGAQGAQGAQGQAPSGAKKADAKVSTNLPAVRDPGDPEGAQLLAQRALNVPVVGIQPASLSDQYDLSRGSRKHEAIDLIAPTGTPVVAVDDGRIAKLFTSKPGGLTVYQFDPEARLAYYYAHLQRYADGVREGMDVKRGDLLGYVGATGNADPGTPHLHFAVFKLGNPPRWWEGEAVNPYPALSRGRASEQVAMR